MTGTEGGVSARRVTVLMEELDTGLVHRGRRTVTAHQGIVQLHYRPD